MVSKLGLITPAKVTVIFNELPGENLLQIDPETDFYVSWPVGKEWQAVKNHGTAGLGRLLPREERQAIEQELENIESKFNEYLQQKQKSQESPLLPLLLHRVTELQQRIYHPQGALHLTYPFFLPIFALRLALLQATYQNKEDFQESLNELLFGGLSYLKDALESAYKERYEDINLKRSGPHKNLGYVEDTRSNKSLTQWVSYTKTKASLATLKKQLSAELAVKYVEEIHFSMAWSVIDDFIEVIQATQKEAKAFSIQKAGKAQIAKWKKVSKTTSQADSFNSSLITQSASEEPLWPEEDHNYVLEYYKTLVIGAIGDLPIPGAATLSALTGLFISWLFPGQQDKWKKYAEAIADYIAEQIEGLETTQIENDLITAEEEFDDLCKQLDSQGWEYGQPLSQQMETRFITLIYNLNELRQALYNPFSPTYTTFPYFDRLFTLYGAVLGTATTTLSSYDTYDEFTEHFEKSRDYLDRATTSACQYRKGVIKGHYEGLTNLSRFQDHQSNSWFSDKRPLHGSNSRWDGYGALSDYLKIELGNVYPNRLKILAGIRNFDTFVTQYNEFWVQYKPEHVRIPTLWDEWASFFDSERNTANGKRSTINKGYDAWSNGPGVHNGLYFDENMYRAHFYGPRLYKEGSEEEGIYIALTDYPRAKEVIPLENFDKFDISPAYNVVVFSEEEFQGQSYTFSPPDKKHGYPLLSGCGFTIKSLKIVYRKSH